MPKITRDILVNKAVENFLGVLFRGVFDTRRGCGVRSCNIAVADIIFALSYDALPHLARLLDIAGRIYLFSYRGARRFEAYLDTHFIFVREVVFLCIINIKKVGLK